MPRDRISTVAVVFPTQSGGMAIGLIVQGNDLYHAFELPESNRHGITQVDQQVSVKQRNIQVLRQEDG